MTLRTGRAAEAAESMPACHDDAGGVRGTLCGLFPVAPARAVPLTWSRRALAVAAAAVAAALAAAVLLLRIPGIPAWDTIYSEDYSKYLVAAFQVPWHLFIPYNGYEQLLPRVVAQLVTYLPLADAAKALACTGALIAAGCALFVFHASAGYIRSAALRILLAAAVILLSIAPMEIADSTVDAFWYLLLALFWAVLWRPRTRAGMAVAAVIAFVTAATTTIVIVFAPLLAVRVFALRRVRDHAVTAGWLAGCLFQMPFIIQAAVSGQSRLVGGQAPGIRSSRPHSIVSFYLHDVVLRSVGWHLSWWLESRTTEDRATLIVGAALVLALGVIMATQAGTRLFVAVALLTGFLLIAVCVFLTPWAAVIPVKFHYEVESRYSALPIFLIEAAVIVGADHALRRRRGSRAGPGTGRRQAVMTMMAPTLAVTVMVAFLAVNWAADFQYKGMRSAPSAHPWYPVVVKWHHECETSRTGEITVRVPGGRPVISCDHLRFLCPPRPGSGQSVHPDPRATRTRVRVSAGNAPARRLTGHRCQPVG